MKLLKKKEKLQGGARNLVQGLIRANLIITQHLTGFCFSYQITKIFNFITSISIDFNSIILVKLLIEMRHVLF